MSFPYLAKSTIKYKSPHATDLSFAKDEKIRVTGQSDDDEDWLIGESLDGSRSGGFPKDFITPIEEDEEVVEPVAAKSESTPAPATVPEAADPAPPVPVDAPPPPSPKLDPSSLPQSPAPAPAPSQVTSTTSDKSPASSIPAPAPAAPSAVAGDSGETPDPSQMTMKDRLAFFAAAQGKAGPPPPIKPKPASGGLTWSQRQKLRQEEEAKQGGGGAAEASIPAPAPVATTATANTPAQHATPAQPTSFKVEKKEGTGMSASDAQSSIGKGGSLKERMAALQGAGAFGQADEPSKSTAPAPSGKVWKRPPAPEPAYEDEEADGEAVGVKSPMTEEGDGLAEAGEEEEPEKTEEEQEKARKAAIAARMAKLGSRGPMSMAIPPKPARKPTRESISSPTAEAKQVDLASPAKESRPLEPEADSPSSATSPPTSVPMPAIARRTAPPRRRGPPSSSAVPTVASTTTDSAKAEDRPMSVGPNNGAEPPPQVMVYDEEKPLPKTDEQKAQEKEFEEAGQKPGGADGAAAAGIALAPVSTSGEKTEVGSQLPPRPSSDDDEDEDEEEDDIMGQAKSGGLGVGSPVQQPEMVPIHPPADSPMTDDDETPPPPPPRMTMSDMPKDEIEMKHQEEREAEDEEDEDDEEAPPPPQRDVRRSMGGTDKPLGPRPLPSPGKVGFAPPLPPQGNAMIPPRDESEDEREAEGQGDEEEDEDEAPPPPPPVRRPSVPVPARLQMPTSESGSAQSPASPRAAQSPIPQSPKTPMRAVPPPPATTGENEGSVEDDEASRRSNIAARMAKLGGIKFGAPPVPNTKRSMSSGPSSAIDETPKSPIRETPTSPTVEEGQEESFATREPVQPSEITGGGDGEETPEQEAARRRATLARLRAGGSLGFGMFGQKGHDNTAAADERGLETEDVQEEEQDAPSVPAGRPIPPQSPTVSKVPEISGEGEEEDGPPPPPARPSGSHSRSATAQSESDFAIPPPSPGRPTVPTNRPMPPPPISTDQDRDNAPFPPARPAQSPSLPQSPIGRPPIPPAEKRMSQLQQPRTQELPPPPIDRQMTDEPGGMDDAPPPPPRPVQPASPVAAPPASPRRSTSIASRSSGQPVMPPASRQGSRMEEQPRSSISQGRPGFNDLQEASKVHGSQLIRAAKAMFSQGRQANFGDGSPAGFVLTAMQNAQLPPPQGQWGHVILEQEGSSVLKRSDEPRPGDIAAFYDAKLKGKKGLSSYTQNVGSVEEPLLGIVSESETKKHKLRVLQVERGTPEEVSYRCDDLKSGRVVVFRPGV